MKVGWVGRGGRRPSAPPNATARDESSLNRAVSVNTFVETNNRQSVLGESGTSTTNRNHDHCESEDILFLVVRPPTVDRGETDVCDSCTTGGVHKDGRLSSVNLAAK